MLLDRDRAWASSVRNVETYMSYFAANATIYPPAALALSGNDAIRRMATERLAVPGFSLAWTPTSASVSSSGDLGYTVGTYVASAGGTTENGKYLAIWRKHDGSWKVVEDIFNTDSANAAVEPPAAGRASPAVKP